MKRTKSLVTIFALCLLFGGINLVIGLAEIYSFRQESEGYLSTTARFAYGEDYKKPSLSRLSQHTAHYFVYTYYVDGDAYEIKKDFLTNDYPFVGSARTVYYNPANPRMAVLDCSDLAFKNIKTGAIFVAVSAVLFVFVSRRSGGLVDLKHLIFGG